MTSDPGTWSQVVLDECPDFCCCHREKFVHIQMRTTIFLIFLDVPCFRLKFHFASLSIIYLFSMSAVIWSQSTCCLKFQLGLCLENTLNRFKVDCTKGSFVCPKTLQFKESWLRLYNNFFPHLWHDNKHILELLVLLKSLELVAIKLRIFWS